MLSRPFAIFLNFLQKNHGFVDVHLFILTLITAFRDEFHFLDLLSTLNDIEVGDSGERLTVS